MKIIIAHKYWYFRDGSTTHVFDLAELLASHGHTVIPFAMQHPDNAPTPYAKFFVTQKNFATPKNFFEKIMLFGHMVYSLEAKKKFAALVEQERPDIVHIHNIYHHISPSILDVCKKKNIPVVQTVHDYKLVCPNYKLFAAGRIDEGCLKGNYFHDAFNQSIKGSIISGIADALEMSIHRMLGLYRNRIARWIVPSNIVAEKLIEGGFPKEKISVMPHFLNSAIGSIVRIDKKDIVVCAGRLSEEKGFDVAIRAMKSLNSVSLVIAGQGPMCASLERIAKECSVQDRVTFAGMLSRQETLELMASARLTIVPSLWHEPFGYTALESLAVGTPVVASRIGALSDVIGSGSDKFLVSSGDPDLLAQKINELLSDKDTLSHIGDKGREYALKSFQLEDYYAGIMQEYMHAVHAMNTKVVQGMASLTNKGFHG